MNRHFVALGATALLSILSGPFGISVAQTVPKDNPAVCYVRVTQTRPSSMHGDLAIFAEKLLTLRFAEIKSISTKTGDPPDCTKSPTEPNAPVDFYLLKVSISGPESIALPTSGSANKAELVLNYELSKYSNCISSVISQRTQPFTDRNALTNLDGMANTVALLLEEDLAANKVVVQVNPFTATRSSVKSVANQLTYEMIAKLNETENFRPQDTPAVSGQRQPDFKLDGEVNFDGNDLTARFKVRYRDSDRAHFSDVVRFRGRPDEHVLRSFYRTAGRTLISFLSEVQYGNRPLLPTELPALLVKAKSLMCKDTATCEPRQEPAYEEALPLLLVLSERMNQEFVVFRMLGIAQFLSENYLEAAQAYDRALELLKDADINVKLRLLEASSNSWYLAKNFDLAAARAEEGLKIVASEPDTVVLALLRIHSYSYGGRRSKAIDCILEMLAKPGTAYRWYFLLELFNTLYALETGDNVSKETLVQTINVLHKSGWKLPDTDVLNTVYSELTPGLLSTAEKAYKASNFQDMEEALKRLESFPQTVWPISPSRQQEIQRATITGSILRLRGLWYRDAKGDLDQAIAKLDQGRKVPYDDLKNLTSYELALTYIKRARNNADSASRKADAERATVIANDLLTTGVKEWTDKANYLLDQLKNIK